MKTTTHLLAGIFLMCIAISAKAQWNANPFENNPICTAEDIQFNARAVSDGNGGSVIVWHDYRHYYINIYAQHIDNDGYNQWENDGIIITTGEYEQFAPEIISDGNNGYIIVWMDDRNDRDIYAQKINQNGEVQWTENGVPICTASTSQWSPKLVSDNAGGAIITWYDYRNELPDIYVQRINGDGNVLWNVDGIGICTSAGYQNNPQITSDLTGGAFISWNDYRNSDSSDVYIQHINSEGNISWTENGVVLCDANDFQSGPLTIDDSNGGAVITWADRRTGEYDIYAQRVNNQGETLWASNGIAICSAENHQSFHKVIKSDNNSFIITWEDRRNTSDGNTGFDIYAQLLNMEGSVNWTENGIPICNSYYNQYNPTITTDGLGGAFIAWEDYRSADSKDLYIQHINASGISQWDPLGVPISVVPQLDQGYCELVPDGNGGVIATWLSYYQSLVSDIFASHITSSGKLDGEELPLPLPNFNVSSAENSQLNPQVIPSQDGGIMVVWQDGRYGDYDIYAQLFDQNGDAQWTINGVPVCSKSGNQTYPMLVPDGADGAVIAWQEDTYEDFDISAQRIDKNGNIQWQSDGISISATEEIQYRFDIAEDGSGGAYIVWADFRGGYYDDDIYGQHISGDGTLKWEINGRNITPKDNQQTNPQIISDGNGGAYVAWWEASFGSDIYGQHINADGTFSWDEDGIPVNNFIRYQNWEQPAVYRQYMTSDGSGNALFTWTDERELNDYYNKKIYSQKVDNSGTWLWEQAGLPVCTITDMCNDPYIISDQDGGAISVWWDQRNGLADIYSQRVHNDGTVSWVSDGVAICTAPEKQQFPVLTTDGNMGAIYAWQDLRDSTTKEDIYVQRVDANGNVKWEENGILMCNAISHQIVPQIETDRQGGAFVVWSDNRKGTYDLVMGIVRADGTLEEGSLSINERKPVFEVKLYPNPASDKISLQSAVFSQQSAIVEIYDLSGRKLFEEQIMKGTSTVKINLRDLTNGIYFCKVEVGQKISTKKLIIQK